MNQRLTRRQFGGLALGSTVVAGLSVLTNKTFAQTSNLVIYGARPLPKDGVIVLQSLNLTTGVINDLTSATLESGEKLTVFTSLADGTFILAISPIRTGKKENEPPRLVFIGGSSANKTLNVSGLTNQVTFESLLGTNDGSLYGLVLKKNFVPPVELVSINKTTGEISLINKIQLPETYRFSNLTQCLNGTIYTNTVGDLGETSLVQLDPGQGKAIPLAQLKFNNQVWDSGLSDLVCSPAGQLFALGTSRYGLTNNLYTVNPKDGAMTLLREWDVKNITIPHV